MKIPKLTLLSIPLLLLSCSGPHKGADSGKVITKDLLYKHCQIPEQREMPLSQEINACDDFYGYVCNEVIQSFELPSDRSRWTFSFTDNAERILCAKKEYFNLLDQGYPAQSERLQPARNLFLSCMNQEASTKVESTFIKKELDLLKGIKTKSDLVKLFKERIDSPIGGIIAFWTPANQDDSNKFDVSVGVKMRYLRERSYTENKKLMNEFKGLSQKFFQSVGLDKSSKRAQWVVNFEKAIHQKLPLPAQMRKRFSERRYQPREHFKKYDQLGIDYIFSKVPKELPVRDVIPEAMEFLNSWVKSASLEELKSVYAFYTYEGWLDDAYPTFFKMAFDFNHKYLGGSATRPPRNERCTKLVMENYGMELDEELIQILFPNFNKQKVVDLAEEVRESIIVGLKENKWLSDEARKEAIRKIADAKLHLVHPDNEDDWNFLPELNLSPENLIENILKIGQAEIDKHYEEIKEERSKTKWWMGPLTSNAYYSSSDNKFVMLLGILQYPFYDEHKNSEIENIGAIGTIVGHELGHSIDDNGSRYDASGKLRQWMNTDDLKEFKKRGSQFNERFEKIGHNGELTLGENIGDHVGLTSSFHAAFPNPKKASPQQLKSFFEAYGRAWCQKMRPKYREAALKTDPHALGYARVNEQVIHLDGFYNAYQCKSGDKMYVAPEKRIRVW